MTVEIPIVPPTMMVGTAVRGGTVMKEGGRIMVVTKEEIMVQVHELIETTITGTNEAATRAVIATLMIPMAVEEEIC